MTRPGGFSRARTSDADSWRPLTPNAGSRDAPSGAKNGVANHGAGTSEPTTSATAAESASNAVRDLAEAVRRIAEEAKSKAQSGDESKARGPMAGAQRLSSSAADCTAAALDKAADTVRAGGDMAMGPMGKADAFLKSAKRSGVEEAAKNSAADAARRGRDEAASTHASKRWSDSAERGGAPTLISLRPRVSRNFDPEAPKPAEASKPSATRAPDLDVPANAGTTFSVSRGSFIDLPRKEIWDMVYESCAESEWNPVARVIARLESILHVEQRQRADSASTALTLCNVARVLPRDVTIASDQSRDSSWDSMSGDAGDGATFDARATTETRGVPRNLGSVDADDAVAVIEQLQWFAARVQAGPLTAAEADLLDGLFMRLLLGLAATGRFGGLCPRDVALARSLNDDKLSQLYVRVDESTLDERFTAPFARRGLPSEAQKLLLMKRGTGIDKRSGLLLVAKVDYLQLLVVQRVRDAVLHLWSGFVGALKDLSDKVVDDDVLPAVKLANVSSIVPGFGKGPDSRQRSEEEDKDGDSASSSRDSNGSDVERWGNEVQKRGQDVVVALQEWGMNPRTFLGGLVITLSDIGLIPKVDIIQLPRFDAVWPVRDSTPVRLRRVTLKDVFAAHRGSWFKRLLSSTTLEEPTWAELLVVFRRHPDKDEDAFAKIMTLRRRVSEFLHRVMSGEAARNEDPVLDSADGPPPDATFQREPVQLRVLGDIPMAYWQAVFPDKLLQYKPLDGFRLDLVTVAGVAAVLAQVTFTSPVLELLGLFSVGITVVRSVLGYRRMLVRYENFVNDMIASKTLAQEDAVLEFLAGAGAAQRFSGAALAYVVLSRRRAAARAVVEAAACANNGNASLLQDLPPWLANLLPAPAPTKATGRAADLLAQGKRLLESLRPQSQKPPLDVSEDPTRPGLTARQLEIEVEAILACHVDTPIRFDAETVVADLRRLGLLQPEHQAISEWLKESGLSVFSSDDDVNMSVASLASSDSERACEALMMKAADQELSSEGALESVLSSMNGAAAVAPKALEQDTVVEERWVAVTADVAEDRLTAHWTLLLEDCVATSLASVY